MLCVTSRARSAALGGFSSKVTEALQLLPFSNGSLSDAIVGKKDTLAPAENAIEISPGESTKLRLPSDTEAPPRLAVAPLLAVTLAMARLVRRNTQLAPPLTATSAATDWIPPTGSSPTC